jgi:hypothetical protein
MAAVSRAVAVRWRAQRAADSSDSLACDAEPGVAASDAQPGLVLPERELRSEQRRASKGVRARTLL